MPEAPRSDEVNLPLALLGGFALSVVGGALGALVGGILLLIGASRYATRRLAGLTPRLEGSPEELAFLWIYVGAFVALGVAVGLLWPLRSWRVLFYSLSLAITGCGSLLFLLAQRGPVGGWEPDTWIGFAATTALLGAGLGYGVRRLADRVEFGR